MGNSPSSPPKPVEPPVELHVFKELDGVPMEYSIPEIPEKRKPTDQFFLMVFFVLLAIMIICSIYTLCYSDLNRVRNGYDNCGNVCGEKNPLIEGINCTGKDFTEEKILMYKDETALENLDNLDTQPNECVNYCDDLQYTKIMNRCFKVYQMDDRKEVVNLFDLLIGQQVIRGIKESIGYIVGMAFIALGLCFLLLLLFKYFISGTVRTIIISTMLFTIGLTIHLWVSERKHRTGSKWLLLIVSIVITVGVFLSWKKINFVIKVFKETTNAVFAMPFLMLLPIWVFIIDVVLLALLLFFMVMYYSSGVLTHVYGEYYTYYPTGLMVFTVIYTLIFYLYLSAFLHGCQQVIVAGAISTWYFSREKDNILGSPILDSFRNLRKYHLGSVAFGSFIVTLMKIIRIIVKGLLKKRAFICFRIIINCCIDLMEEFVHYASEQAYIVVAMHGQPFLKSGKRATKLLIENALSTLSVNTVGDFVLWMSKILVGIGTMICGEILDDGSIPYFSVTIFIGGCLGVLLAHSVFRNFEICVDTIFLCYCEDTYVHDGIEHPYYATVGLVAVVDEAKGVIEEQKMYDSIKTEAIPQTFV